MKVRVIPHAKDSNVHGNIMWAGKFPMKGGEFPANHPVQDPRPSVGASFRVRENSGPWENVPGEMPVSESPIGKFRAAGYWASCFPEGDGITYKALNGQSDEQQRKDVEECFGWTIVERF